MIDIDLLKQGVKEIGLSVSDEQAEKMKLYAALLFEKNKVMNLTRVPEEKYLTEHFLDSVLGLKPIVPKKDDMILDIGTGAGFPGVPIAVMCPYVKVFLMDSTSKKINFVRETCEKLQINNVEFIVGRAETEAHNSLREKFDIVYARAVSDMKILAEISIPFVKVGGYFVALKSINYKNELNRAKNSILNLGGKTEKIFEENIPLTDTPRSLILIKKHKKSDSKYPRAYEVIKR